MGDLVTDTPYSQVHATVEALDAAGITSELAHRLRTDADCLKRVSEAWTGLSINSAKIYAWKQWQTVDDVIQHYGLHLEGDLDLQRDHPLHPTAQLVHIYDFNRAIARDEVLGVMEAHGHRPATIRELLIFGSARANRSRPLFITRGVYLNQGYEKFKDLYMIRDELNGASYSQTGWKGSLFLAVDAQTAP